MHPNSLHASFLHTRNIASLVHQRADLDRQARKGTVLIDRGEGCRAWDLSARRSFALAGPPPWADGFEHAVSVVEWPSRQPHVSR